MSKKSGSNFHPVRTSHPTAEAAGAFGGGGDGAALTPERLTRSVLGRSYFGKLQQVQLAALNAEAEARMGLQRKEWKARHRERLEAIAKEQRRKARVARKASKRKADGGT